MNHDPAMKSDVVSAIRAVVGERLTTREQDELAGSVIDIIANHNRNAAIAAVDTVKETLVKGSEQK